MLITFLFLLFIYFISILFFLALFSKVIFCLWFLFFSVYYFQGRFIFCFCCRNAERHGERISFFCRNPEESRILPNNRRPTTIHICLSHSSGRCIVLKRVAPCNVTAKSVCGVALLFPVIQSVMSAITINSLLSNPLQCDYCQGECSKNIYLNDKIILNMKHSVRGWQLIWEAIPRWWQGKLPCAGASK